MHQTLFEKMVSGITFFSNPNNCSINPIIVMLLEWGRGDCAHTLQIIKNHYKKTNILGKFGQNQPPSTRSTVGLKSEKVTASWLDLKKK